MNNGYKFAALARGESLQSPDTCECCGRDGLKKTVKLINPAGKVVWFGVGCAARAMGCEPMIVRKARADAIAVADENEKKIQQDAAAKEDARWHDFLTRSSNAGDRFTQIQQLGGYAMARAAYKTWRG